MKALFVHFYDFAPHSGISKKIIYQIDALKECGMDVELCYMDIDEQGHQRRLCGNTVVEDFGKGFSAKFLKWFKFSALTNYILLNNIDFVYIRSIYNTNPFLLKMLRRLKAAGVKVVMEFPTYPYDKEVKGISAKYLIHVYLNKIFRHRLKKHLFRIVTFSDFKTIHGVKTINISNGIDFSKIKLKAAGNNFPKRFNLIGVAELHFWHGFDRMIRGLSIYYNKPVEIEVYFDIVGEGDPEKQKLIQMVKDLNLEKWVHFHGNQFGTKLDSLFERSDLGIASLARHRSGITNIKTLKNREYAARGIPFIYSEIDDDFESMPYVIKAPVDESPIDVDRLIDFYSSIKQTPLEIRESIINTLTWKVQMQKVIDETF